MTTIPRNIYEITSADTILAALFSKPAFRPKKRGAQPSLEQAMDAITKIIGAVVAERVAELIKPSIEETMGLHIMMDGEFIDSLTPGEWTGAMDDRLEELFTQHDSLLSADWLANYTIGFPVHEEGGVDKLALAFGKEIHKTLTFSKNPKQILSNAGLTEAKIAEALQSHLNPSQQEKEQMAQEDTNALDGVIAKIAAHVGKDYDRMSVFDDLDLASDDDDILAQGAGARLGLEPEDIGALQIARFEHEDKTAEVLESLLLDAVNGKKRATVKRTQAKEAAAPAAEKPKASRAKKPKAEPAEDAAAEAEGGSIPADLLTRMKDAAGLKDADMAQGLGVSRATFNNWLNGKTVFTPDTTQWNYLRSVVVDKLNTLHECLGELDGKDAEVVY